MKKRKNVQKKRKLKVSAKTRIKKRMFIILNFEIEGKVAPFLIFHLLQVQDWKHFCLRIQLMNVIDYN